MWPNWFFSFCGIFFLLLSRAAVRMRTLGVWEAFFVFTISATAFRLTQLRQLTSGCAVRRRSRVQFFSRVRAKFFLLGGNWRRLLICDGLRTGRSLPEARFNVFLQFGTITLAGQEGQVCRKGLRCSKAKKISWVSNLSFCVSLKPDRPFSESPLFQ